MLSAFNICWQHLVERHWPFKKSSSWPLSWLRFPTKPAWECRPCREMFRLLVELHRIEELFICGPADRGAASGRLILQTPAWGYRWCQVFVTTITISLILWETIGADNIILSRNAPPGVCRWANIRAYRYCSTWIIFCRGGPRGEKYVDNGRKLYINTDCNRPLLWTLNVVVYAVGRVKPVS